MIAEEKIQKALVAIIRDEFGVEAPASALILQKTRKEFEGDFTLVVFPLVKMVRRSPELTAEMLGKAIMDRVPEVGAYNVIKGFLNLSLRPDYWLDFLKQQMNNASYGITPQGIEPPVVVEYSSPNTNKPLHLGHIRNNLLGYSVASILEASGKKVYKVNLVNDRGIHICKSMLAWMKFGKEETPESSGKKGDKLVGDYYVRFETELRQQVKDLVATSGMGEEEARKTAPLMQEAQKLLRKWELRDPQTMAVWELMNGWVYEGFDATYKRLGVDFDKVYHESDTYLLGKDLVKEGLEKGVFERREDGSVWVDLTAEGLDEKLLLRSDGTSVYITQDLGTAQLRYDDFQPGKMIYVVGNEQNYHFDVLQKVLAKLEKPYSDAIFHLSYGMVELPEGKMKSREGTVVDADDLMEEMVETARRTTEELGKTLDFSENEKARLFYIIGLGALKYFILKVDPKKNMLFNPAESIDFNGNTGPFIQYTYARIRSILRTAGQEQVDAIQLTVAAEKLNLRERNLLRNIYEFPAVVNEAAEQFSPAEIANYTFELCKEFNQFYHEHSVLNEPDQEVSDFRVKLSQLTAQTIKNAMTMLGIEVPERM
ncbi:MAG: arginine--tRNA ligase [Bacteroides sp.]|jgi:arginyl-tRNA synthetase|nr:arginine--tRNA ligase [Bacteroides sp.]